MILEQLNYDICPEASFVEDWVPNCIYEGFYRFWLWRRGPFQFHLVFLEFLHLLWRCEPSRCSNLWHCFMISEQSLHLWSSWVWMPFDLSYWLRTLMSWPSLSAPFVSALLYLLSCWSSPPLRLHLTWNHHPWTHPQNSMTVNHFDLPSLFPIHSDYQFYSVFAMFSFCSSYLFMFDCLSHCQMMVRTIPHPMLSLLVFSASPTQFLKTTWLDYTCSPSTPAIAFSFEILYPSASLILISQLHHGSSHFSFSSTWPQKHAL